jgi:hypothetical protein
MKFDDAINYIAESTLDTEMAKPKNPAILAKAAEYEKKGLSPATAYAYARKDFLAGKLGDKHVHVEPKAEPSAGVKYKELPDTLRTKDAVATYLQHNPEATEEEVVSAVTSQNSEETPLNLDPEVIKTAIADARSEGDIESEPDPEALRKQELAAKYDRVRQALYKMHGFKSKKRPGRKVASDEPEEEPGEIDYNEPKINMRDEPIDPTEL